jgi:uncharacterized cupin superfamily protein
MIMKGMIMSRPIINIADLEFRNFGHGVDHPGASNAPEKFQAQIGDIGRRIGAQKLGYNLTVVPAGKRAFPFHNHRANEEMFFVLDGKGEVRIGSETHPIRTGDAICCPPGGPETAHQIVNTSNGPLKYLAVSTRLSPEIAEYPESGKFGVYAEYPSPDGKPKGLRFVSRATAGLNYWDGE